MDNRDLFPVKFSMTEDCRDHSNVNVEHLKFEENLVGVGKRVLAGSVTVIGADYWIAEPIQFYGRLRFAQFSPVRIGYIKLQRFAVNQSQS